MPTGFRESGDFCWINVLTSQPEEARAFFASVLGWTYFEMPGMGHGIQVAGRNIGGIFNFEGPDVPASAHVGIGVMVKVDSADATSRKIEALGGSAKPAFDIGESGRMAVCLDPCGAPFDLWEPKSMLGTDADRSLHGSPSWSECLTTDVGRATRFYTELFGWSAEVKAMPGMEYVVFRHHESDIAGLMRVPMENIPSHWGTYFTVHDPDEAARVAEGLGGKVFIPPMDIPEIGRFTGLISPQGVRFYAIHYLPRQGA